MAFPTIPTGARILTGFDTTAATSTFPSLSSLTKNPGDLLIAIVAVYQSTATAGAVFSGWGGGFTEFVDQRGGTTQMSIGAAYKWSDGTETGTFNVTIGATVTGHAGLILMSIPGAHPSTPPEGGTIAVGTTAAADPGALDPAGWGTEDTLWIAVGANGETATTGSYTGMGLAAGPPTNYGDAISTGESADAVGAVALAVAFRQLNAGSENIGTWSSIDLSNARNVALPIAVRPGQPISKTLGIVTTAGDTAQAKTFFFAHGIAPAVTANVANTNVDASERDIAQTLSYSVNTGIQKTLGVTTVAMSARPLVYVKPIKKTLGVATNTNTAQALPHVKTKAIGVSTTPSAAQALTKFKTKTLGVVTQPNTALLQHLFVRLGIAVVSTLATAITLTKTIVKTTGVATTANAAQTLAYVKPIKKTLGVATTPNAAQPVTFTKTIRKTLGIATNVNTAQTLVFTKVIFKTISFGTNLNTAQTLVYVKPIRKTLGIASFSSAAGTLRIPRLTAAVELDVPQPAGKHQAVTINAVTQLNTAVHLSAPIFKTLTAATNLNTTQALTFVKPIVKSLGIATSANAAQALTFTKTIRKTLGIVAQPNTAQALIHIKTKILGLATQPNSAQAVTYTLIHFRTISVATQPNTSQTLAHIKTKILGLVTNLNSAQALRRPKLGVATELDIAQPAGESQAVTLGVATTANASQPLTFIKTIRKTLGIAAEADSARTQHIFVQLGIAIATTLAEAISFTKSILISIGISSEADTARPSSVTHVHFRSLGVATTSNVAQPVLFGNFKAINNATESDSARTLRVPRLSAAIELDVPQPAGRHQAVAPTVVTQVNTARPLTATKTIFKSLGTASTANTAQPITERKVVSIGVVTQPNSARPLTVTKTIQKTIGAVTQPNTAQTLTVTLVHFRTIGVASTTNTARPLSTGLALVPAHETDTAHTPFITHTIYRTLGLASTVNTALTPQITHAQNVTIGPASTFESSLIDVHQVDKTVTITLPRQIVYF